MPHGFYPHAHTATSAHGLINPYISKPSTTENHHQWKERMMATIVSPCVHHFLNLGQYVRIEPSREHHVIAIKREKGIVYRRTPNLNFVAIVELHVG
jgi:hypothetical protein